MCGRYSLDADIFAILNRYKIEIEETEYSGRDEIFPTNKSPIIDMDLQLTFMDWGFSTNFSKRPLINARGETVSEKVTFKKPFQFARCLIPATSFYEWETIDGKKVRNRIKPSGIEIFSMAGIYKAIHLDGQKVYQYSIITTQANEQMSYIHDRMPVILKPDEEFKYLESAASVQEVEKLLLPYDSELIITQD